MMIRTVRFLTILVVLGVLLAPLAHAGDLSAEYLYGRWVVNGENCGSPDSETFEFRKNGTFECVRGGKAEIVGFWELKKDIMELHMVTSPAFFDDIQGSLKGFEGLYNYFHARIVIFNAEKDRFQTIGVLGDEVKRATAVRCQ